MWKILQVYLPRILGVAAAFGAGKLAEKTGIVVDPASVTAAALAAYALAHRVASAKLNPGDAASRRMAVADRYAVETGTVVKPAPPTQ